MCIHIECAEFIHDIRFDTVEHLDAADFTRQDLVIMEMPDVRRIRRARTVIGDAEQLHAGFCGCLCHFGYS